METQVHHDPRNGYQLDYYCPACGCDGSFERVVPYMLAPGNEMLTCQACGQRFEVVIQFVPTLDTADEKAYNGSVARKSATGS